MIVFERDGEMWAVGWEDRTAEMRGWNIVGSGVERTKFGV